VLLDGELGLLVQRVGGDARGERAAALGVAAADEAGGVGGQGGVGGVADGVVPEQLDGGARDAVAGLEVLDVAGDGDLDDAARVGGLGAPGAVRVEAGGVAGDRRGEGQEVGGLGVVGVVGGLGRFGVFADGVDARGRAGWGA
jgi:hypothetical protein